MVPWRNVAAICAAEILGMAGFASFAALVPAFISEWALTNTAAGWISGIYFAGYMAAVPHLVSLTDRSDPRRIYLASTTLGGLANLGYALFADGFAWALLFRALAGVSLAGTYMPGLKILSHLVPGPSQSRVLSFYTSSFSVGAALSFLMSGEVAERLGWRWSFAVASLGSAAALGIAVWKIPPIKIEVTYIPKTGLLDFRPVLRNHAAMGYIIAYGAHMWELFGQRSWIVAFLTYSQSLQPAGSGWMIPATVVAALINLAGVPASIGGNELAMRFGRARVISVIALASALVSSFLGFVAPLPYTWVAVLCLVHGLTAYGDSAAITAGSVANATPGYQGATMALHSFVGFACAFLAPLLFGVVLDLGGGTTAGWGFAFVSLGLAVAIGPIALALLASSRKCRREPN